MAGESNIINDSVVGIDVHRDVLVCCAQWSENGELRMETASFRTFRNDLRKMAGWCASHSPDVVLMEGADVIWKSPRARSSRRGNPTRSS